MEPVSTALRPSDRSTIFMPAIVVLICSTPSVQARFTPGSLEQSMISPPRFAMAASLASSRLLTLSLALVFAFAAMPAQVRAADLDQPAAAEPVRACLNQKERRAEAETGKLVRLEAAIRTARTRMAGTVVRARLCQGADGLVYVLTVLAHDGKVARIEVDAVKGTLIGGL
jgi:uncharacterized membrane protein YkoI